MHSIRQMGDLLQRLAQAMVAAIVGLVPAAGCHRVADAPTTVRGVITFQGRPLAGGRVVFTPDPDRGGAGKPISAGIGANGSFQLALDEEPSVPPGWYRVAIAASPLETGGSLRLFPRQLARPDQSGLVREVKSGRDNVYEFRIEVPSDF